MEPLAPLKVFILGPRLASQCGFDLDAEVWDPTMPGARIEDFRFSWACSSVVQVGEPDLCAQLPQFTTDASKTDGTGASGHKLRVKGGQLIPGIHRFSVIVSRASGGPQTIARNPVDVAGAFFTTLRMVFPSYAYSGVIEVADGAPPVAAVMALDGGFGGLCVAPEVHWQWFLVEDRLRPILERPLNTSSKTADGLLQLQSGGGGMLLAGISYYHVLLQANSKAVLDEALTNVSRPSLDSVLRRGVTIAVMSPRFVADRIPSSGGISAAHSDDLAP